MSLNVNCIGVVKPRLLQLTESGNEKDLFVPQFSPKRIVDLTEMASSIQNSAQNSTQTHDVKTADLTNVKEDAKGLAEGFVKNPTVVGLLTTILERTIGVPSVADADKVIAETLKNVQDPSIVKNIENAWSQWKKNYYKNGDISNGGAIKAGVNLIPIIGRGICNGILETGAKVTQDVLGEDGAKVVSNSVNTVANSIKTLESRVIAPFKGIINIIKGDKQGAKDAYIKVWADMKDTGKSIGKTVTSASKYFFETAKNFAQKPIESTAKLVEGVGKGIKTTAETVGGVAKKVGKGAVNGVKKAGGLIKKGFKKLFG